MENARKPIVLIINAKKRKASLSENTHFHPRRCSYNLAFKLKIVAEAEAIKNNSEIAREYGISESIFPVGGGKIKRNLFNGELKMSAKRTTMGRYTPKYPQLDERLLDWFTEQRSQGKFSFYVITNFNT